MQIKLSPIIFIVSLLILSACAQVTPAPLPPAPTAATVTQTSTPLPAPSPTPNPTPTIIPLNLNPQIVTLVRNLSEPDDLLLAPDGSIYISNVNDGTIKQFTRDGELHVILSALHEPEGMAFLPDGSLIIVEQGINQLSRYDFSSGKLTQFLSLKNDTKNLGVDGILWDGSELVVPDSPNGNILAVSSDGSTVRQIASGLARPTGAWMESTGDLLMADENGNAVYRLHRDGTLEKVASLSTPDDVIEDASGNIFIATLGDNAIHVIIAQTKQDMILVDGLNSPQGIIFDMDGNLIVTDSGNHRLLKVVIH